MTLLKKKGRGARPLILSLIFCGLLHVVHELGSLFILSMPFPRLRSNPYFGAFLSALPWIPVAIFFVDHGYSYARVSGRSMQVI